jgi:hypothetical protein
MPIKTIALNLLGVVLWAVSLFVLIPPPLSDPSQHYSYVVRGIIAAVLFALSRIVNLRTRMSVVSMAIESLILVVFGWVLFQRLQIHY